MASKEWRETKASQYREMFPEWDEEKVQAMVESLENIKDVAAKEKRKRKNK